VISLVVPIVGEVLPIKFFNNALATDVLPDDPDPNSVTL